MKTKDEKILPGNRIGKYFLDISEKKLLQQIGTSHRKEQRSGCIVYHFPPISFYVDEKTRKVDQICVFKGFAGKFLEDYGIGDDLLDIENDATKWLFDWESNIYSLEEYQGILFELEEGLAADEVRYNQRSTIGSICIFNPKVICHVPKSLMEVEIP